jgi:hypothetical protein
MIRAKHDYKIVRKESKITWNHKKGMWPWSQPF